MDEENSHERVTDTVLLLEAALKKVHPDSVKLFSAIGAEATLVIAGLLGGQRIRIPRLQEIAAALNLVAASLLVQRGVSVGSAAARYHVYYKHLQGVCDETLPHIAKLNKKRKAYARKQR